MRRTLLSALLLLAATSQAQWQLQNSRTTADLRGIDNVGGGVAWASGSDGTILRTEDAGLMWQLCAKPPGGEHLDFRAIQAFDNNIAIVMSSGKGDQSRLYKTTDGCQTWKLLFTNPDKDGFWDALKLESSPQMGKRGGLLLGDPVGNHFALWEFGLLSSAGARMEPFRKRPRANANEACFAASNSSLFVWDELNDFFIATGGKDGARFIRFARHGVDELSFESYPSTSIPVGNHTDSSGVFSIAPDIDAQMPRRYGSGKIVAVGGDYLKPNDPAGTAAFTTDGGTHWTAATAPPHGYRSAVAYDAVTNTWITVGPNGTDISTDDGRNWRALKPNPALNDTPDADQHWNALSLPFAVGPHGRIGTLRPTALQPSNKTP